MAGSRNDRDVRQQMERIEFLLREVEGSADPHSRGRTREIVQAVLDLHGAALERMLETIAAAGEPGLAMIDALARDGLVGSVLLLYGLHPLDLETRVRQALDAVRPQAQSHGDEIELLAVADGAVRLRIQGSGKGCASSARSLRQAVEQAIYEKAPDAATVEIEEATARPAGPAVAFVPVEDLVRRRGAGL